MTSCLTPYQYFNATIYSLDVFKRNNGDTNMCFAYLNQGVIICRKKTNI